MIVINPENSDVNCDNAFKSVEKAESSIRKPRLRGEKSTNSKWKTTTNIVNHANLRISVAIKLYGLFLVLRTDSFNYYELWV